MKKRIIFLIVIAFIQGTLVAQKKNQVTLNALIEKMVLADEYTSVNYQGYEFVLYDQSDYKSMYNLEVSKFIEKRFGNTEYINRETGKLKIRSHLMLISCSFLGPLILENIEFYGQITLDGVRMHDGLSFTNCDFLSSVGMKIDSVFAPEANGYFLFEPVKPRISFWNCTFKTPDKFYFKGDFDYSLVNSTFIAPSFYFSGNATLILYGSDFLPLDPENAYEDYLPEEMRMGGDMYDMDTIVRFSYGQIIKPGTFNMKLTQVDGNFDILIDSCRFMSDSNRLTITEIKGDLGNTLIRNSKFQSSIAFNESILIDKLILRDNKFLGHISFSGVIFPEHFMDIPWNQLAGNKIADYIPTGEFQSQTVAVNTFYPYQASNNQELDDKASYYSLIRSYNMILNAYKDNGELEYYNACYSEMKDVQGRMYKNEYLKKGQFRNYFNWKLNRLLKLYSNHGTDPALAIVITIYVILFFAIIYFIFPSEWDQKSKARLFEDFRTLIRQNDKGYIKPFFSLLIGILYSLINAITLSLNAFVTLGFGNIPTRGIARYMCVLQGFIGWFLLSIFTVALINQVLF